MDWIDKLNKELEERRERNKTSEAKDEAKERERKWIASQGGKVSGVNLQHEKKGLFARDESKVKEDASKGGTISGQLYKGKFLKEYTKNNPNISSIGGKIGGKKNVESGHIFTLHKKYGEHNTKFLDRDTHQCPHCQKIVNGGVYHRWHGNNCQELQKIKKQIEIISSLPEIFTSNDVVKICKELNFNQKKIKYGLCKNPKYIEILKSGTNQTNPSIFKKLYLDNSN